MKPCAGHAAMSSITGCLLSESLAEKTNEKQLQNGVMSKEHMGGRGVAGGRGRLRVREVHLN